MDQRLKNGIRKYYQEKFNIHPKFIPGQSSVPVSGKVFDEEELFYATEAVLDGWWTEGRFAKMFEKAFSQYLSRRYVSLVNSGSSANLLALACLTSAIFRDRRLQAGDEFITSSVAFPTTVNPGILYGLKPVFLDVDLDTLNPNPSDIERAISQKTKVIMLAHTLGKPNEMDKIAKIAKKNNLWLIEDCCDALGSKYDGKLTGTYSDIATFSFYPAHQITMGEGGAVVTDNPLIHRSIRQFRDWGRDCWCDTGQDNTCGKRFSWKLGRLPVGYDHKYSYSQRGFNLKLTDMQAAIGLAQLKKLPLFIKKRQQNYFKLFKYLSKFRKYLILPKTNKREEVSYFGLPMTVKENAQFKREDLVGFLESHKIITRSIFSGNLLNHPAYEVINYRKIGKLENADAVMLSSFWIGVYPGLTSEMIDYVCRIFSEFFEKIK
ncbi:lipopolysaccharide biosynthesis protein RfbH [Candidatus Gottesmanbacteria bacterium RIFCSPLOWO2_02_FULL_42_29]|nr:MAG: lipopolysaccharide biosynthesis protein RfbH [Candidatus Gottesmanbacteria bacterium RIFCSPHIGHO2_01_FULL_42_27]OGG21992.1 MAG: lipopolysaccharide biosynthesis protein RfbH [Candidatus Gottesmanbacteria bacterium RIFCSPHIGHO2_12_FULL_43_26]OGG39211.1 MAG: lipopolysaccharide biosynthesis protein RfbH [Candidatus Gottesmanbacteria bacterium RIFCSPLOWO2_02_FULL_42_29]